MDSFNEPFSCLTSYSLLTISTFQIHSRKWKFSSTLFIPLGPFPFCSSLQEEISKQISLVHLQFSQSSSIKSFYFCPLAWSDSPGFLPLLLLSGKFSLVLYMVLLLYRPGHKLNATFLPTLFATPSYPAVYPSVITFSLTYILSSSTSKGECVHNCACIYSIWHSTWHMVMAH